METLTPNAQATLLLTAHLAKSSGDSRPLSPTEWGRFAAWLRERELWPGDLLTDKGRDQLSAWQDERLPRARLEDLLGRGTALAVAVEKWQRAGLRVVTRSDPDYPKRLKERLGTASPPALFLCGNPSLLSAPAIAVVGSRKASPDDLRYAAALGAQVARAGLALVSGGARGVDEAAMLGALEAGGSAVGVLADSLLKAAVSQKWRAGLRHQDLLLLSPFHPEAGFNVGNAMARNKYVYCLALAAVVVHSGASGGTWSGAVEDLQRGWVPLWVKPTADPEAGSAELVQKGGHWLPEPLSEAVIHGLTPSESAPSATPSPPALVSIPDVEPALAANLATEPLLRIAEAAVPARTESPVAPETGEISLYEVFCLKLRQILADGPRKPKELATLTALTSAQLKAWLQQATEDGLVMKRARPERYELARPDSTAQLGMFD